eukprot:scaffold322228_cov12-Tisochrysis_lutea.AAC.1
MGRWHHSSPSLQRASLDLLHWCTFFVLPAIGKASCVAVPFASFAKTAEETLDQQEGMSWEKMCWGVAASALIHPSVFG